MVAHTPASFVFLVRAHRTPSTTLWADATREEVHAVLNDNAGGLYGGEGGAETAHDEDAANESAGWGDHRVTLALQPAYAWSTLLRLDRTWTERLDLAGFLAGLAPYIVTPDPEELCRAVAGPRPLPMKFIVTSPLWRGASPQRIEARLEGDWEGDEPPPSPPMRHREPMVRYTLTAPDDLVAEAMGDLADSLSGDLALPVVLGRPAKPRREACDGEDAA